MHLSLSGLGGIFPGVMLAGIETEIKRFEYGRETGGGSDSGAHSPVRRSVKEAYLVVSALLLLERPIHAAGEVGRTEYMNGSAGDIFEQFARSEMLVVLLGKSQAVVCAGNYDFESDPFSDVERAELAHRLAHSVWEIGNSNRHRGWESSSKKSIQDAATRNRRHGCQFRQDAEFVQSPRCADVEERSPVSTTRKTQPD
jgi:hypothetical protein